MSHRIQNNRSQRIRDHRSFVFKTQEKTGEKKKGPQSLLSPEANSSGDAQEGALIPKMIAGKNNGAAVPNPPPSGNASQANAGNGSLAFINNFTETHNDVLLDAGGPFFKLGYEKFIDTMYENALGTATTLHDKEVHTYEILSDDEIKQQWPNEKIDRLKYLYIKESDTFLPATELVILETSVTFKKCRFKVGNTWPERLIRPADIVYSGGELAEFEVLTPKAIARRIHEASAGAGTDEDALFKALAHITYGTDKYNETDKEYKKYGGIFRSSRSIVEELINELEGDELRKAFGIIEYDPTTLVVSHLLAGKWDTDTLAGGMSNKQMGRLQLYIRVALIREIATGVKVGDDDEETIIRLIKATPTGDIEGLFNAFKKDNSKLLQKLESAIDGDRYTEYHQVIYHLFTPYFYHNKTSLQAYDALSNAPVFEYYKNSFWRGVTFKPRTYFYDAEINGTKIDFKFWSLRGPFGSSASFSYDLFKPINIHFIEANEALGVPAGQMITVPAYSIMTIRNEEIKAETRLAIDVALTFSGAGAVISATSKLGKIWAVVETTMGVADIAINEMRSQIAETPEGRAFLRAWDITMTVMTVYTIGKAVIEIPKMFKNLKSQYEAYKKVSTSSKSKVEKEVDKVLDEAEEASKKTEQLSENEKKGMDEKEDLSKKTGDTGQDQKNEINDQKAKDDKATVDDKKKKNNLDIEKTKGFDDIDWKSGKAIWGQGQLSAHYKKHVITNGEFGKISMNEYHDLMMDFLKEKGAFKEARLGNQVIKYDPATNRVLAGNAKKRETLTFYKALPEHIKIDPWTDAISEAQSKTGLSLDQLIYIKK